MDDCILYLLQKTEARSVRQIAEKECNLSKTTATIETCREDVLVGADEWFLDPLRLIFSMRMRWKDLSQKEGCDENVLTRYFQGARRSTHLLIKSLKNKIQERKVFDCPLRFDWCEKVSLSGRKGTTTIWV